MKIEMKPISSLTLDPENNRDHDEENLTAIENSLKRFGQQKPIVINPQGVVKAGNGTAKAAQMLGWKEIATVTTQLDDNDADLYAVADNRTSDLSTWNLPRLEPFLKGLDVDTLEDIGFNEMELDLLFPAPDFAVTADGEEVEEKGPGFGEPVIQAQIVFDTEGQQARFRSFIRHLRATSDMQSTAECLDAHICEFLGIEADG
jgi:hypothetical protein